MKMIIAVLAASLMTSAAFAEGPVKVPGCLNYKLINGKVIHRYRNAETPAQLVRGLTDPESDRYSATGGDSQ